MLRLERLEARQLLSASSNRPRTLTVDDDGPAQYSTIQDAVNAANPGDTIKVAPGTYDEAVTVDKKVSIVGAQASKDPDRRILTPNKESILEIPDASIGFSILANNVSISGFTIRPDSAATADVNGIAQSSAYAGVQIKNNLITGNTIGVYLNSTPASNSSQSLVSGNSFVANNLDGSAAGNAIYSDQGLKNAVIKNNDFTGDLNASVIVIGGGTTTAAATANSNIQIVSNCMDEEGPIILVNTTRSLISCNDITDSSGSAIFFGGAVSRTTVSGNYLNGGANSFTGINLRTDGVNYPVAQDSGSNPIPNNYIDIVGNTVKNFGDSGIRIREGANHISVKSNRTYGNGIGGDPSTGDGISVEDSTLVVVEKNDSYGNAQNGIKLSNATFVSVNKNTTSSNGQDCILVTDVSTNNIVSNNVAKRNTRNGIHVDADAVDNLFEKNEARQNGSDDLFDDSTGTGTAGTGNTWKKNKATTSSPAGIRV